jgi:hypothetical protein
MNEKRYSWGPSASNAPVEVHLEGPCAVAFYPPAPPTEPPPSAEDTVPGFALDLLDDDDEEES